MNVCPICSSPNLDSWKDKDNRIEKCRDCFNVSLKKSLWATEASDEYYELGENYVSAMEDDRKVELSRMASSEVAAFVKRNISLEEKDSTWLDIGANFGVLVEIVNKEGFIASGIEPNIRLVELASKRGVELHPGFTSDHIEVFINKCDIVSAIDVLEHVPEAHSFLNEVNAVTKLNGHFVLEVPNIESFLAKHHGLQWKYVDREHIHYFSLKTLSSLLEEHGFKVVSSRTHNPFLPLFSIKKLLQYYVPSKLPGDRLSRPLKGLSNNAANDEQPNEFSPLSSSLRSMLRSILIYGIKILKREDFLIVVAKKVEHIK